MSRPSEARGGRIRPPLLGYSDIPIFGEDIDGLVPGPSNLRGYFLRDDGTWAEVTASGIEVSGQTQGSILYYDGTEWTYLPPSTNGYVLRTQGDGANPIWSAETAGSGTPASSVVPETSFGLASAVGISLLYARADHTHGTPTNPITAHVAASDPHTQYQKESEKGATSGYASLGSDTLVPTTQLGSGTPDSTTFLRGDKVWAVPPAPSINGYFPGGWG